MEGRVPMVRLEPEPSSDADDSAPSSISEPGLVGLDVLCDEILVEIIRRVGTRDVGYSGSRISKYLVNLAMCSRRLNRLTEPILYNELTQINYPLKRSQNLLLIFRKILARPDLARCVKRFSGASLDGRLLFGVELTDQDRMRLRAAVDEASTSEDEADRWIEAAESGQWAAIVALLLSMTPNLEELAFGIWWYHNDYYTYLLAFLDRAKKLQDSGEESPFAMSKLRSVSVHFHDTESGRRIHQLMPFLELRSVETFHAHMVQEDHRFQEELTDRILKDPQLTLNAKDLSFTQSAISHYDMVVILRCFPQLERFRYEFGAAVDGNTDFEPPLLLAALEHLKPCLKELTLLTDLYLCGSHLEGYPIGSLADFQKLVSITANVSILIGLDWDGEENEHEDTGFAATLNLVRVVPPTLEFLCLKDCQQYVVRHIFELVSQKTCRTPALRKIDLGWEGIQYPDKESPRDPIHHPGFSKDQVGKLMADCEAADIAIIVKYLPPKPKFVSFREKGEPVDEKSAALGFRPIPMMVHHFFPYPYEGYEDCCEQHGCDPETGRPRT